MGLENIGLNKSDMEGQTIHDLTYIEPKNSGLIEVESSKVVNRHWEE